MRNLKITVWLFWLLIFLSASSGDVFGFTTNNTTITRTFNKSDAAINELITVTVTFTNSEAASLRGFYYAEQIPQGLVVSTTSVKINGNTISNYIFESGSVGDVYPGNVVYRWILETPTAFSENNPISSGSTVQIVYSISSIQAKTFNLDEFHWVGYYQGGSKAAFGHSEDADKKAIRFFRVNVDFDKDGKTDIAVWRPGDGYWYILRSSDQGVTQTQWGTGTLFTNSDIPVPGN